MVNDEVDLARLRAWMDRQGVGTGPIRDAKRLSGGTQNILLRFERDDQAYVLRRPPPALRPNSNETMRREARVLAALHGSRVPHPRLIAACDEEDVIGVVFYLMEPIDGFTPAAAPLPAPHATDATLRHRIGLSMVEAIGALHSLDYRAAGLDGFGKPDNFLERQVNRWKAQLASYEEFPDWTGAQEIPGVDKVARWLETHRPADSGAAIIHGDFHLGNVMVRRDSGDLAAVVDWELSTIGDPLLDLGWLIATWPEGDVPMPTDVAADPWDGFARPGELAAHYGQVTGRDLTALDWYVVLACFKLGIILEGTHARASAGKAPRDTGDQLHAHTIDLFERALRRIS